VARFIIEAHGCSLTDPGTPGGVVITAGQMVV
jgi:hypothetical protein